MCVLKAIDVLRNSPIIGIDTEWQPKRRKGDDFPLSILQLSSLSQTFVFDLLVPPKNVC